MSKNTKHSRTSPSEASQVEKDAFASMAIELCHNRDGSLNLIYDREHFAIKDKAKSFRMNLSNAFADYCHADEQHRGETLPHYIEAFFNKEPIPSTFAEARARLYPAIYNRWTDDIANLTNRTPKVLTRRLTDNLNVEIVLDLPTSVHHLTANILAEWKVTEAEIFDTAYNNLRKGLSDRILREKQTPLNEFASAHGLTPATVASMMHPFTAQTAPPMPSGWKKSAFVSALSLGDLGFGVIDGCPGLFFALNDDWYSPSRLLIEDWIRMLPVKGDPVALVTHSGRLFVTGTEDKKALQRMASIATQLEECSHRVSNIPVRLTAQGWQMYQPERAHPAYESFHALRCKEQATCYLEQQQALKTNKENGFVASCLLASLENGSANTISVWTKDVNPLLPQTDLVTFVAVNMHSKAGEMVVPPIPWDTVQDIVGHRMELTQHSPPRYRVRGFPDPTEIVKLQEASQTLGIKMTSTMNHKCGDAQ